MLHALSTRHFAQRLNKSLDDLGMPPNTRERAAILSKMLQITRQRAWMLLEGHELPDDTLLQKLAKELEVEPQWLLAKK